MAEQEGGMNTMLAELFGTGGQAKTAAAEDQEKLAQVELFAKLAAENGIDLDTLEDRQIRHLWDETFSEKTAADTKAEPAVEKQAEQEFAEKRAAAVKVAEAEYLGRVMAHAMVQELGKIGEAQSKTASAGAQPSIKDRLLKVAGEMPPWLNKGKGDKDGDKHDEHEDKGEKKPPFGKKEEKDEKKEASAIDAQAAKVAVDLAKQAGLDVKVAGEKVAAVLTLGAKESTKIAAAPDFKTGLHVRALELLEQAGYPVTWESAQ